MRYNVLIAFIIVSKLSFGQTLWNDEVRLNDYFTPKEISLANTAEQTSYLKPDERDIYLFNNLVRMYPRKFIPFLKDYVANYEGNNTERIFRSNFYYRTLLETLRTIEPKNALYPDLNMYQLATCWAKESGQLGLTGHKRINCEDAGAENCAYSGGTPLSMIMLLLIDEGVQSLGHRENMLDDHKGLGAAIQSHKGYGKVLVQDFSYENDLIIAERKNRKTLFQQLEKQWTTEELTAATAGFNSLDMDSINYDFYKYFNLWRQFPSKFKTLYIDNYVDFDYTIEEVKEDYDWEEIEALMNRPLPPAQSAVFFPQRAIDYARCAQKYMDKNNDFSFEFSESCRREGVGAHYISTAFLSTGYELFMDQLIYSPENLEGEEGEAIIYSFESESGYRIHVSWW